MNWITNWYKAVTTLIWSMINQLKKWTWSKYFHMMKMQNILKKRRMIRKIYPVTKFPLKPTRSQLKRIVSILFWKFVQKFVLKDSSNFQLNTPQCSLQNKRNWSWSQMKISWLKRLMRPKSKIGTNLNSYSVFLLRTDFSVFFKLTSKPNIRQTWLN